MDVEELVGLVEHGTQFARPLQLGGLLRPIQPALDPDPVEVLVDEARRVGFRRIEALEGADIDEDQRQLPCFGFSPSSKIRFSAIAPQISLPWVSAFTMTCGPGLPLSKVWT